MTKNSKLPDISLPFLVFGTYKPHAYNWKKINNVDKIEAITETERYIEKIVPLKINKNKGYLIYFHKEHSKEAYDCVSNYESDDYEWKSMEIDGGPEVNLLIQKPKRKEFYPDNFNFELPFFAYGIFKPGQIAFSKISEYVKCIKKTKIHQKMILMDAMALVTMEKDFKNPASGYLIYFNKEDAEKAYDIISETEPNKIYEWKTSNTYDDDYANLLISNHPKIDSPFSKIITNYDGAKDPFFKDGINVIEKEIINCAKIRRKIFRNLDSDPKKYEYLFKLQLNYLLLWAIIERFSVLKYGKKNSSLNNEQFAGEKKFKEYIEDNFKNRERNELSYSRSVFSPKKLKDIHFDKEDCNSIISYYYTIRCNVAHRGKELNEVTAVYSALNELLTIFKEILKDTFNITTIAGINFYIPYGLKEYREDEENTKISTFKKDNSISIEGIPDYTFKIIIKEETTWFDDNYQMDKNSYVFVKDGKLIKIIAEGVPIENLIDEII